MCDTQKIIYYEKTLDIREVVKNSRIDELDEALNICDLTKVEEKYRKWEELMPRVKPYYAVKCNDDQHIVQTLADLGANFDCASKNEIKQVLSCGVSPDRIIFANPCKPTSHLQYAKDQQIKTGTVDNEFEIYKIHKQYPESNLVVRFRSEAREAQCPLGDKFGCDAESDATALMLLAKSLNLNVIGTSFHVGSGCSENEAYDRAIKISKNLFKYGELLGFEMNLVDIGGGFPGNDDVKFKELSQYINKSLDKHFPNPNVNIIAEPGRYFAASAFTLVCKIHAKREVRSGGKLDTIMHYLNDGVYGMFNCILYDHQHVEVQHLLDDAENLPKFKTLLWGPSCDALDKIAENLMLPNLNTGDYLVFSNMGAYTMPIASPFNGFSLPTTLYYKKL